jgi:hypothetical protein
VDTGVDAGLGDAVMPAGSAIAKADVIVGGDVTMAGWPPIDGGAATGCGCWAGFVVMLASATEAVCVGSAGGE